MNSTDPIYKEGDLSENSRKTHHILELKDSIDSFQSLVKDIELQRELYNNRRFEKQFYFDTSSIIDMIHGFNAIIKKGVIDWRRYKKPATLVYALGYKNWLGPIFTLPPHMEEFISKIQSSRRAQFPEYPEEQGKVLENQFWGEQNLEVHKFKEAFNDEPQMNKFVKTLKKESLDLFKGIYLASNNSFWKARYKFLVKDNQVLRFSNKLDYNLGDITDSPLFSPLLKHLNEKRREKSSNNYIDTIALCMLDEKIHLCNENPDRYKVVPIFFSDQDHILEAAKFFSEKRFNGRRPFTFVSGQKEYLVVRNANYFIIEGIMNALYHQGSDEIFEEYVKALKKLEDWLKEKKEKHWSNGSTGTSYVAKSHFQRRSEEKFFLEFFDRWWEKGGLEELKNIIDGHVLEGPKERIDAQVHQYIEEERKRINKQFSGFQGRLDIIRETWSSFRNLPSYIDRKFSGDAEPFDVYQEFSPRFAYLEDVCEEVQGLIDRIFDAVFSSKKEDSTTKLHLQNEELEEAEAEIVKDLADGIFGKGESASEDEKRLNQLSISLAVLWIFERYDLINMVCDVIRQQHESNAEDNDDMYPTASIALIHAASNLKGRNRNTDLAVRIISCVEKKFCERYSVWISLSYLYYLLWDNTADGFEFPELLSEEEQKANRENPHLQAAFNHSFKAVKYLEKRRKEDPEVEKRPDPSRVYKYRQRRYYYALNNYLFFLTILSEPETFQDSENYANRLGTCSRDLANWQPDRFPDTLARYYYRKAYIAESEEEFHDFREEAIRYNNKAIEGSIIEKNIYMILRLKLKHLKWKNMPGSASY
jgi:hypothetical protein